MLRQRLLWGKRDVLPGQERKAVLRYSRRNVLRKLFMLLLRAMLHDRLPAPLSAARFNLLREYFLRQGPNLLREQHLL